MFRNRISQYLPEAQNEQNSSSLKAPRPRRNGSAPKGFVPLPETFQGGPLNLYQMAYQAAHAAAEQKLLELLRSRRGLN